METIICRDRKGTDCVKWDIMKPRFGRDDLLAMWVADMDFAVPECVREALIRYSDFGVYGYRMTPASYEESYLCWQERHHGIRPEKEWLRFSQGGVTGVYMCVAAFTEPGDAVAVMTPAYPPFLNAPKDLGRKTVTCPLANDRGYYTPDFAAIEELFINESPAMLIWCAPHNPTGRVWTEDETKKLLELCRKYNVVILSDEIHQDFCREGHKHVPIYSFTDYLDLVVCLNSPAKTFNLAGCNSTTIIIPDETLRAKYDKVLLNAGNPKPTTFAQIAYEAAYTGGDEWLEKVLAQVEKNTQILIRKLADADPRVVVSRPEGVFLIWIDFAGVIPADEMKAFINDECNLFLNQGTEFGGDAYATFVRMNLATSEEIVTQAADNIAAALKKRNT